MIRARPTALERDLVVLQRASALIAEFGVQLDRQLREEARPSERLRFVREATNRITRTANDAIHAYRRARRLLDIEEASGTRHAGHDETRTRLRVARREVLAALEKAGMRYPWSDPDSPEVTEPG